MRRLLLVVTAALVMAAMVVAAAMPAFAVGGPNSPGNSGHLNKSGPGGGGPGPGGGKVHHNGPGAGFQTKDTQNQQCTENLSQFNKPCVAIPSK